MPVRVRVAAAAAATGTAGAGRAGVARFLTAFDASACVTIG